MPWDESRRCGSVVLAARSGRRLVRDAQDVMAQLRLVACAPGHPRRPPCGQARAPGTPRWRGSASGPAGTARRRHGLRFQGVRKWEAENPERRKELHRAAKHRYRTALGSVPYLPLNERAMFEAQQGLCAVCCGSLGSYHVDHIIPVSRGGWSVPANYQLLCVSCNLTKSSRFEWTPITLRVFNAMVAEMPIGWQVALINSEIVTTKASTA